MIESDFGRSCLAMHSNQSTAAILGINTSKLKHQVFLTGCIFAGLGGALYAHLTRYVSPDSFSLEISFFFSLVVIVGGMGSFWGPFLGAVVLLLLPETLHVFQEFKLLVYGFILLVCIVMLPKGLVRLPDRFRKKRVAGSSRGSVSMEQPIVATPQNPVKRDRVILRVLGVSKSFGKLTALNDVSLSVKEGSVHGLIGPNGSGKTTLVNTISSTYNPDGGQIFFNGRDITAFQPHKIARLGIGRTFQNISVYSELTVLDNILVGLHNFQPTNTLSKAFDLPRARRHEEKIRESAKKLAALVGLEAHLSTPAEALGHNHKRFLEIARALGLRPSLILLDEPGAGLSGEEMIFLHKLISHIRRMGISILLIEHHVEFVIDVSDFITVLNYGVKIAEGSPAEITNNQDVIEAYLGIREGTDV